MLLKDGKNIVYVRLYLELSSQMSTNLRFILECIFPIR